MNSSQTHSNSIESENSRNLTKSRHALLLKKFNESVLKRNVLSDIELEADGSIYKAHRLVLSCFSHYLERQLLNIGKREQYRVLIPKVEKEEMEILLHYMYTGKLKLTCENFLEVYKAASALEMTEVLQTCIQLLEPKGNIKSCFYFFIAAKKLQNDSAYSKALQHLAYRFEETVISREFLNLNIESVLELLSAQTIGTRSEIVIFLSALNWLNHDYTHRSDYIVKIMGRVRFSCMNMHEIIACYHPPILPQILEIPEIVMLLYKATCYITAKFLGQENLFRLYEESRRNFLFEDLPLVLWHDVEHSNDLSRPQKDISQIKPARLISAYTTDCSHLKRSASCTDGATTFSKNDLLQTCTDFMRSAKKRYSNVIPTEKESFETAEVMNSYYDARLLRNPDIYRRSVERSPLNACGPETIHINMVNGESCANYPEKKSPPMASNKKAHLKTFSAEVTKDTSNLKEVLPKCSTFHSLNIFTPPKLYRSEVFANTQRTSAQPKYHTPDVRIEIASPQSLPKKEMKPSEVRPRNVPTLHKTISLDQQLKSREPKGSSKVPTKKICNYIDTLEGKEGVLSNCSQNDKQLPYFRVFRQDVTEIKSKQKERHFASDVEYKVHNPSKTVFKNHPVQLKDVSRKKNVENELRLTEVKEVDDEFITYELQPIYEDVTIDDD